MLTTAFTDLVGCQVPIQQAGMGGVATPEMAAAVADAGGLGMVSMVLQPADAVAAGLDALAKQTAGQVGINFLMPFLDPEAVEAACEWSSSSTPIPTRPWSAGWPVSANAHERRTPLGGQVHRCSERVAGW